MLSCQPFRQQIWCQELVPHRYEHPWPIWCYQRKKILFRRLTSHIAVEEVDRIIVAAHAINGNRWASIARLLQARTDNATKNCWSSTFRHEFIEVECFKGEQCDALEDATIKKTTVSSEETTSYGDVSSLKLVEGIDAVNSQETISCDFSDEVHMPVNSFTHGVEYPHYLYQPVARLSAFSPYNYSLRKPGGSLVSTTSFPGTGQRFQSPIFTGAFCKLPGCLHAESQVPI
ncbi:putative transcription factor MYB-HB-like family [Dioscorea sansibarensis]